MMRATWAFGGPIIEMSPRASGRKDTGALAATTASLSLQVATALRVRVLVDVFTPVTLRAEAPTVMARGLAVDTAVGLPLTSTVRNPLTSLTIRAVAPVPA